MPKFNMYQSLHTTVIGPEGLPLEIQIRTREMHDMAEFGVAAHWIYKEGAPGRPPAPEGEQKLQLAALDARLAAGAPGPQGVHGEPEGRPLRRGGLRLHAQGRGQVAGRRARRRWTSPTRSTPSSATAASAPRSTARSSRCNYALKSGDIVEVLTSKRERGPSRDWLAVVKTTRARNKIKQWFKAESREDTEHTGRELLQEHLQEGGPARPQKITGSPLLADVIREMGFRKADDFYIALGGAKISPKVVVNKVLQRLKQGEAAEEEIDPAESLVTSRQQRRPTGASSSYGIQRRGRRRRDAAPGQVLSPGARRPDRRLRLARPRHHDPPRRLPEHRRAAQGPRALRARPLGGRQHETPSRSSCRSTPGTATACSRTSRARSPRRASTSSRPAASSRRRWSRTASSSRSPTPRRSRARSGACATSTASSTPTASRRARAERAAGAARAPVPLPLTSRRSARRGVRRRRAAPGASRRSGPR